MFTLNHFLKGMAVGCVHYYTDNKLGHSQRTFSSILSGSWECKQTRSSWKWMFLCCNISWDVTVWVSEWQHGTEPLCLSLSFSLPVSVSHSQKDHYIGTPHSCFSLSILFYSVNTGVLYILSESMLQNIWLLLIMATTRKFWTAIIEREFSVATGPDGYSSQLSDEVGCLKMKKIKKDHYLGEVQVGTWSMDLHKEVAGLAGVSRATLKNKGSTPLNVLMLFFTGVIFSSWCDSVWHAPVLGC